jgi:hypothetical protein
MHRRVFIVHFGIILELVKNAESARIPHDGKHEPFTLNVGSWFYDYIIPRKSPHVTWFCTQENHDLSLVTRWYYLSHSAVYKKNKIAII